MESKKTNRANLENKKVIFLQVGFIVALSICLLAFEWRTYENNVASLPVVNWEEVNELLPINTGQHRLPPPPRVVKPVYTIKIVDNPDKIFDDWPVIDAGTTSDWQIPDKIVLPEEISDPAEDTIYNTISLEVQPEFPGGETALYKYLSENIKYPRIAIEANIQGTAYIGFVVEKDGRLSNIRVERTPDEILSNEALRVVSIMPDWSPGKQGGKSVRVSFYLPVKFKLQ
jgi:periplasmic protein TonB